MQPVTCANDYLTRQRCRRVKVEVEGSSQKPRKRII